MGARVQLRIEMLSTDEQGLASDRVSSSSNVDLATLQCSICQEILWKPIACQSCETPFCSRCIAMSLEVRPGQCPMRCDKYVQRSCPRFVAENLSRLQIFCIYRPNGCSLIVPYEALEKHEKECDYQFEECSGCQLKLLRKDRKEHEAICPSVPSTCDLCQFVLKRSEFDTIHTELHCLQQQLRYAKEQIQQMNERLEQQAVQHQHELHRIRQECEEHIQKTTGVRTRWPRSLPNLPRHAEWTQNGLTVAGGLGQGGALNQLSRPFAVHIDDDQTLYIADWGNHRIVAWQPGATQGEVVAGGQGQGNRTDQLNNPTDVLIDKDTDSLIISDMGNRRIVRWSYRTRTYEETILDDIDCTQILMDNQRCLYVSDVGEHEVRRYRMGETDGTVVAGGDGPGFDRNQLRFPTYLCFDRDESIFVADTYAHRVMKWPKDATEGTTAAGHRGRGSDWTQLFSPNGIVVDQLGALYVVDLGNHRVVRWFNGVTQLVGGNDSGLQANQLDSPSGLAFDRLGNMYVVDHGNHRVQRFDILRY